MRNHGIVGYPSFRQSYMNGNIKILISKDENVGYPIFRQTHTNQDSKVLTKKILIFAVIIPVSVCFIPWLGLPGLPVTWQKSSWQKSSWHPRASTGNNRSLVTHPIDGLLPPDPNWKKSAPRPPAPAWGTRPLTASGSFGRVRSWRICFLIRKRSPGYMKPVDSLDIWIRKTPGPSTSAEKCLES